MNKNLLCGKILIILSHRRFFDKEKKKRERKKQDCGIVDFYYVLEYFFQCNDNANVYYYNAENAEGKITNDGIINGLNWMVKNSVKKVNISLSNKKKYLELEKWIDEHKDTIKVFASYNNVHNTNDYPAMFKNVYASGTDSNIDYKSIDFHYRSNRIVMCHGLKRIMLYRGNSFLSVYSMMKN